MVLSIFNIENYLMSFRQQGSAVGSILARFIPLGFVERTSQGRCCACARKLKKDLPFSRSNKHIKADKHTDKQKTQRASRERVNMSQKNLFRSSSVHNSCERGQNSKSPTTIFPRDNFKNKFFYLSSILLCNPDLGSTP